MVFFSRFLLLFADPCQLDQGSVNTMARLTAILIHVHAAIDMDGLAGNIARAFAGQK
ncbi:MAG: hypothetical protein ACI9SB_002462, partial [Candidatus Azotimanducaceae bacterium]